MSHISRAQFEQLLRSKLGARWERACAVYEQYSPNLTFDTTNVLLHAAGQGAAKVDEVLTILEEHAREHFAFTHPEARGRVTDWTRRNYTEAMFLDLCQRVLGLQPNRA